MKADQVRLVVILGHIGKEASPPSNTGGTSDPHAAIMAPMLIYRWPQKELVFSGGNRRVKRAHLGGRIGA